MDYGVLIIALNRPYYGHQAVNLAASIKACAGPVSVALLHDVGGIQGIPAHHMKFFDHKIQVSTEHYYFKGKFVPLRLKTVLPLVTPFSRGTLFIDADSVVFPRTNLNGVMQSYLGHGFVPQCSQYFNHMRISPNDSVMGWGNIKRIMMEYQIRNDMYSMHTYYMYFDQSEHCNMLFRFCQVVHDQIALGQTGLEYNQWGNQVPDELCMCIAGGLNGTVPYNPEHPLTSADHRRGNFVQYRPFLDADYFPILDANVLMNTQVGISMCGNPASALAYHLYESTLRLAERRLGTSRLYDWKQKTTNFETIV